MTKTVTPTATVEIPQSGYLPGDTVSLKVSVSLNRRVKSLQGIIITLYRECHVDIHPAIPLGPSEKGKRQEYEDYYPRSRTGLGGLSLSSGGSSRVFRQDIDQTFTPLIIDPRTFTANVKTSVKVPENVFPTITSVPGAMIEFKYYVEAVIDLRGKSSGQERILPRLSMVNSVPSFAPGDPTLNPLEGYDGVKLPFSSGFCFLETSQIRREKGVLTHISEIVVGTCDSSRQRSKLVNRASRLVPIDVGTMDENEARVIFTNDVGKEQQHYKDCENQSFEEALFRNQPMDYPSPRFVPPLEVEDHVDEKTRLQRAERLLLPSAPPNETSTSSSATNHDQASAPTHFDDYDFASRGIRLGPSAPAYEEPSTSSQQPTTRREPRHVELNGHYPTHTTVLLEDKQELERQRLQAQASSPEEDAVTTESTRDAQATAPVLDEDSSYNASLMGTQQRSSERLPQYQR